MDKVLHPLFPKFFFSLSARGPTRRRNSTGLAKLWGGWPIKREAGEKRARTFTKFYVGTVDFRRMSLQVSRICTMFYVESVLEIFASFAVITYVYVSNMYKHIYLDQS
jgi:hypothetical protein